jgi:hypothetical protein
LCTRERTRQLQLRGHLCTRHRAREEPCREGQGRGREGERERSTSSCHAGKRHVARITLGCGPPYFAQSALCARSSSALDSAV